MSNPKAAQPLPKNLHTSLQRRRTLSEAGIEATDLLLTTLQNVSALSGVPFLQEAAGLALGIVRIVQNVKDNKEAFRHLAHDACRLVYTAVGVCNRFKEQGRELSEEMCMDLAKLVVTLGQIEQYSQDKIKRGLGERIIFKRLDQETIRRYREELKQALDTFSLQSTITIRHGVTQIERAQVEILRHLKQGLEKDPDDMQKVEGDDKGDTNPQGTFEERDSVDGNANLAQDVPFASTDETIELVSSSTSASTSTSSSPKTPSTPQKPIPYHSPSFAFPVSTILDSNCVIQHVWEDKIVEDRTKRVSNINSGNVTTTIISNSNNDYSRVVYGPRGVVGPTRRSRRR